MTNPSKGDTFKVVADTTTLNALGITTYADEMRERTHVVEKIDEGVVFADWDVPAISWWLPFNAIEKV